MGNLYSFFTNLERVNSALNDTELDDYAYGPVVHDWNHRYKVSKEYILTSSDDGRPPAYAFCDAHIIAQRSYRSSGFRSASTGLFIDRPSQTRDNEISLIMRPINPPDFGIGKIKYIIYRGIRKASLFQQQKYKGNAMIVAPDSNDLAREIWRNQEQLNIKTEQFNAKPTAKILRYHYQNNEGVLTSTPPLPDGLIDLDVIKREDIVSSLEEDRMARLFFDKTEENVIPLVRSGMHIGDFGNIASVEFILDTIHYDPTVYIGRTFQHTINVDSVYPKGVEVNYQNFINRHKREEILNFVDPYAVYAEVFEDLDIHSSEFPNSRISTLDQRYYHFNQYENYLFTGMYIDIRNSQGYSYNYYLNSSDFIRINGNKENSPTDYYRNKRITTDNSNNLVTRYEYDWPIYDARFFDGSDLIEFKLPNTYLENQPTTSKKYVHIINGNGKKNKTDETITNFFQFKPSTGDTYLESFFVQAGRFDSSGAIKISKYIRLTFADEFTRPFKQLTEQKPHFLDYLFAPFEMINGVEIERDTILKTVEVGGEQIEIEVDRPNQIVSRVFQTNSFIDNDNLVEGDDFFHSRQLGIAEDNKNIHFYAYHRDVNPTIQDIDPDINDLQSNHIINEADFLFSLTEGKSVSLRKVEYINKEFNSVHQLFKFVPFNPSETTNEYFDIHLFDSITLDNTGIVEQNDDGEEVLVERSEMQEVLDTILEFSIDEYADPDGTDLNRVFLPEAIKYLALLQLDDAGETVTENGEQRIVTEYIVQVAGVARKRDSNNNFTDQIEMKRIDTTIVIRTCRDIPKNYDLKILR